MATHFWQKAMLTASIGIADRLGLPLVRAAIRDKWESAVSANRPKRESALSGNRPKRESARLSGNRSRPASRCRWSLRPLLRR
jgi:hypothetical protein